MNHELEHIWPAVLHRLRLVTDDSAFGLWLEPLKPLTLDHSTLVVAAPGHSRSWVADRFGALIEQMACSVLGFPVALHLIETGSEDQIRPATGEFGQHGLSPAGERLDSTTSLHPKFTFEQFVIGDGNRLAHAAALAVAEMPGAAYNPLFLCGPPGVGKTHLLHSIAALLAAHAPGLTVRRATGETFTNDFVQAIAQGRVDRFKEQFRHVDVLLVDDVQFLQRKAKTEEEFFHTFNALHESGSQIVLTSDQPPADLQGLEDRLRERFQAGLVADIRTPDVATRMAILRKRAAYDGIDMPDEAVIALLAEQVTANVRALEGALIRVVAYSSLTGRQITESLALEVLDGLYPEIQNTRARARVCSIADIQAATCEYFGLSTEQLLSASRSQQLAWPRQVAMYLARELTRHSLPEIGRHFGGRDHTTVLHAWRRAGTRLAIDTTAKRAVDDLLSTLTVPQHPSQQA